MSSAPAVLVFDVNETLSDLSGVRIAFAAAGAPESLASTWFAAVLRDGFARQLLGRPAPFADLARAAAIAAFQGCDGVHDPEGSADAVLAAFTALDVHPDVVEGVRALAARGIRLVTLSNGAASVAQQLLDRAGVSKAFEQLLTVADAGAWKPDPAAYRYAAEQCGVGVGDAMLVAVHPWDIAGAAGVGMRTAWLRRGAAAYPYSVFDAAEIECADLVDLAAQLD